MRVRKTILDSQKRHQQQGRTKKANE